MYGLRRAASVCREGRLLSRCVPHRSYRVPGNCVRILAASPKRLQFDTKSVNNVHITKTWQVPQRRQLSSQSNLPPYTKVTLPALSPTMETGTLVKWEVNIGDQLEEGDIIAQIETDKATMDMETPAAGYLATILVEEGTGDLPLGKLLAIIVEDKDTIESFKTFKGEADEGTPAATETTPQTATPTETHTTQEQSPSIDYPAHTMVTLPALSPTMETGSLAKWEVGVGDALEEGDIIAQIETDKATMDMETPSAGYLATIFVEEGSKDIPLGQALAVIVENQDDIPTFKDFKPSTKPAPPTDTPTSTTSTTDDAHVTITSPVSPPKVTPVSKTPPTTIGSRLIASPYAKTLARERGVDLSSLKGSGPGGRVIGRDVPVISSTSPVTQGTPTSTVEFEDIPLSGMRKTIANRLQLSKQTIPHYYLSVDINMDDVTRLRQQINADDEMKLSLNDFIIKAAALSMKHVPEVNSSFMDTFIRRYNNVDISVAVSTEGGLITPIVFRADTKGLQVINRDVVELAEKARTGKLKPHEFQGGTFTISNLGMFGIRNFSAVINPPQACILAVGATEKRLIVNEANEKGYSSAPIMSVTLSCDHRVVDGAVGAQWLKVFRSYLEKPFKMLI